VLPEHDNRFRSYSPELGRYISADPIGQNSGPNVYSYVENSPTVLIDPTGLSIISWGKSAWRHVKTNHIGRGGPAGKSEFRTTDPARIQKDADKVVTNPDRVTRQNDGRTLYERDMGREVGSEGQTFQRVVVDDDLLRFA